MIKLVLFDFDGVLSLNGHACNEICGYLEESAGVPAAKIEPLFHDIARQLLTNGKRYDDYVANFNSALGSSLTSVDIIDAISKIKLNDNMVQIAKDLQARKTQVGIITDNNIERLEFIRRHPVFSTFSPIVGSADVSCTKNNCLKIFREALNKSSMAAEQCLFVDDTEENLEIPSQMGFQTYLFENVDGSDIAFKRYLERNNLLPN